ncbi:coat protein [ssRNA phage SRR5467090_3]|uniref:Coat protein n=1 Tax=ssRNA phage SRR5467090_3 TaxID=2786452 RepID=A0A8S5L416_9VIRU|nr:coat protein [ssRNA phage SRR5467090_3]DAD52478.1 TPA_asm: coat protein [ssRNA phage SRR5467090_3]
MANIANIVVFDGAATPVSHTLVPVEVSKENGLIQATWREQIATLPTEAQVRVEMKQRRLKSGVVETRTRVSVPVMESVSGQNAAGYTAAPKVAYEDAYEEVSYAHPRSTITSRRIAKQILTNLSNNVSTTVAAATSGVFDEANVQQVMPT